MITVGMATLLGRAERDPARRLPRLRGPLHRRDHLKPQHHGLRVQLRPPARHSDGALRRRPAVGVRPRWSCDRGTGRAYGWRAPFAFGAVLTAAMFFVVLFSLPESIEYLVEKRPSGALRNLQPHRSAPRLRASEGPLPAQAVPYGGQKPWRQIFQGVTCWRTACLWIGYAGLISAFYFANTWTAKLIADTSGQPDLGIRAGMLIQFGGVIGALLFATMSLRLRPRLVTVLMLAGGAWSSSSMRRRSAMSASALLLAALVGVFANGGLAAFYAISPPIYSDGGARHGRWSDDRLRTRRGDPRAGRHRLHAGGRLDPRRALPVLRRGPCRLGVRRPSARPQLPHVSENPEMPDAIAEQDGPGTRRVTLDVGGPQHPPLPQSSARFDNGYHCSGLPRGALRPPRRLVRLRGTTARHAADRPRREGARVPHGRSEAAARRLPTSPARPSPSWDGRSPGLPTSTSMRPGSGSRRPVSGAAGSADRRFVTDLITFEIPMATGSSFSGSRCSPRIPSFPDGRAPVSTPDPSALGTRCCMCAKSIGCFLDVCTWTCCP